MGLLGSCGGSVGFGALGVALTASFWIGVIALIAYAVHGFGGNTPTRPAAAVGGDRALAMLRERYARGEIDNTEFEERRGALRDEFPVF